MEVISIIVSSSESPVLSVDSFGVLDDENRQASIDAAEECYIEKCVELKYGTEEMRKECVESGCFTEEDFDDYREDVTNSLEDGYEEVAMHTVSIAWSSIDNVQL